MLSLFFPLYAIAAIFGADTRSLVTPNHPAAVLGRSTAVAVLSGNITSNTNGTFDLDLDNLGDSFCSEERFSSEPSLAYACSGFLVGPDLIATAGHCMTNTGEARNEPHLYCEAYSWLFDYRHDEAGGLQTRNIPGSELYQCKEVIFAVKDERAPFRDFALVKLNRPVEGRTPLELADNAEVGDSVTMLGHPLGMPLVFSYDAKVLLNDPVRQSFITNLDAFEGNSGSAVFDNDHKVVGILIGGTPVYSYFPKPGQSCEQYNLCDQEANQCLQNEDDLAKSVPGFQRLGTEVQKVAPLRELLNSL